MLICQSEEKVEWDFSLEVLLGHCGLAYVESDIQRLSHFNYLLHFFFHFIVCIII